jgi:hypothetical protein
MAAIISSRCATAVATSYSTTRFTKITSSRGDGSRVAAITSSTTTRSGRITEASTDPQSVLIRYGAGDRRTADLRDGSGVEHQYSTTDSTTTVLGGFAQRDSWRQGGVLTSPTGETTYIHPRERPCPPPMR